MLGDALYRGKPYRPAPVTAGNVPFGPFDLFRVSSLLRARPRETVGMSVKLPIFKRVGVFAVACLFALTCAAGDDASRDEQIAQHFAAADTNHDGQLTLAEAEAGMPRVAANFSKIDADQSGTVTLAEIEAMADR